MEMPEFLGLVILCLGLYALIKQVKPEYALPVLLAGIGAALFAGANTVQGVVHTAGEMMQATGFSQGFGILVRCALIGAGTGICADLCRDNGASALGSTVELCGRGACLAAALPLLNSLLEIIRGLTT